MSFNFSFFSKWLTREQTRKKKRVSSVATVWWEGGPLERTAIRITTRWLWRSGVRIDNQNNSKGCYCSSTAAAITKSISQTRINRLVVLVDDFHFFFLFFVLTFFRIFSEFLLKPDSRRLFKHTSMAESASNTERMDHTESAGIFHIVNVPTTHSIQPSTSNNNAMLDDVDPLSITRSVGSVPDPTSFSMTALEEKIGYEFLDKTLLGRALTHSSANVTKCPSRDGENLEVLGDASLGINLSYG